MERAQKIISNSGYCSRRAAKELIAEGRVRVNGKVITSADKASEKDIILVDNNPIKVEKKVYLLFNKPVGCVTALRDKQYKTVMEYIKIKEKVFPVGRLDFNTSGLLILTNDGDFANQIMHPRYEIKKAYIAEIDKQFTRQHQAMLEKGIELEDGKTSPAKVMIIDSGKIEVTIHEGKKRIVRRMLQHLGYSVKSLTRVRVGKLELGNILPGEHRYIDLSKWREKPSLYI